MSTRGKTKLRRRGLAVVLALVGGLLVAAPLLADSSLRDRPDATYQTNGRVWSIVTLGDTIYIAGTFDRVRPARAALGEDEVVRNNLAAIDALTGDLLPWNPNADGTVHSMSVAPDGSAIYLGGIFKFVDGQARKRLAAVDPTTGAVLGWSPEANIRVRAVLATEDRVYVGGKFTLINGQPRTRLAAIDHNGSLDPNWTPTADDDVRTLAASTDGARIFAGGDFDFVSGVERRRVVPLDAATGVALPWQYHPWYPIRQFAVTDTHLYVAGDGGGGHLDGYDITTGQRVLSLQTDGGVQAVAYIDGVLYGGGHFDNVCVDGGSGNRPFVCDDVSAERRKLVAIDPETGELDPWNPGANSPLGVFWLASHGSDLLSGGDFTRTGHWVKQQGFAKFSNDWSAGGGGFFVEDFSTGFGIWDKVDNGAIDTSQGATASPSARFDVDGQRGRARTHLEVSHDAMCLSAAVNIDNSPSGSLVLMRLRRDGGKSVMRVLRDAGGFLRIRSDIQGATSVRAGALGTGWHTLEICGTVGTTSSWDLYRDGVKVLDGWTTDSGTSPIGRVEIGDSSKTKTWSGNFDDVAVDLTPG